MGIALSIILFAGGLGLVLFFAEKLVEGAVWTSRGWGVSAFLLSVIFIGFDPENLFLGAVASADEAAGIAMGTVVGSAMVAVALAFGITALFAPMKFERPPLPILALPVLAVVLMGALAVDGMLSRTDGALLLLGYLLSVLYLLRLGRKGVDIRPAGEVAESLQEEGTSGWKSVGLLVLSLAGIIAGSRLIVAGSEGLISAAGISETVFGMTILALVVSIEEVARELPAALKGRPDISFGNVAGSVLAFFLFNAGIISLIHPVPVDSDMIRFYIPLCLVSVLIITGFMISRNVPRWAGVVLVALYVIFFTGGYLI